MGIQGLSKTAAARGRPRAARAAPAPSSRGATQRSCSASNAAKPSQKSSADTDVWQRKVTWSMHVPSGGKFAEAGSLTCDDVDVPLEDVPDTAEYELHKRDEALRADIDESSFAAKTHDDLLLFSDTVDTAVRKRQRSRLKACAQHLEVCVCVRLYVLWLCHLPPAFFLCIRCKCAGVHHSHEIVSVSWEFCAPLCRKPSIKSVGSPIIPLGRSSRLSGNRLLAKRKGVLMPLCPSFVACLSYGLPLSIVSPFAHIPMHEHGAGRQRRRNRRQRRGLLLATWLT